MLLSPRSKYLDDIELILSNHFAETVTSLSPVAVAPGSSSLPTDQAGKMCYILD